jgi:hypothetical protein
MRSEVQHTEDFERIAALPRRRLTKADAVAWAEVLTPELLCKGAKGKLRPWQAYALAMAVQCLGAWLALPVGLGKTLISYLLPVLLKARRSILVIPANLREKTWADFTSYKGVWRAPNPMPSLISREELALESNANKLFEVHPDLLMIDEADDLANRESAAARRIDRYVVAHDPENVTCKRCLAAMAAGGKAITVVVVSMTGTPSRKSIMGYWHLIMWALRERAPMPLRESEALMWASALDERPQRFGRRMKPGPLGADIHAARKWFQRRLAETPGIMIVDGDSAAHIPLHISLRLSKEDPEIDKHYRKFLVDEQNPDGMPVTDPLSRWRFDGQLGCGLFKYYDPPPPPEWREARMASAYVIRAEIDASQRTGTPIETEAQAVKRLLKREHPAILEWLEIKPTYDEKKHTHTKWVSAATVESACEWLRESEDPGIIWCGGVDFAHVLASVARLPYYGPQGKDAKTGRGLHAADARRSMVVSWNANKKGFNLQAWRRQLLIHPPQSAKWLEQIFGRSHRSGQTQPVWITYLATSGGTLDAFDSAVSEAGFSRETVGLTQKLLRANVSRATPQKTVSNRFRWATRAGRTKG